LGRTADDPDEEKHKDTETPRHQGEMIGGNRRPSLNQLYS
jgi:hypothetical protein